MEKNLTILQFAESLIPDLKAKFDMYNMTPEELVGKTVISIRSGFSNNGGGQIMKIDRADEKTIYLMPTELSTYKAELGWATSFEDKHNSIRIFTLDELSNHKK